MRLSIYAAAFNSATLLGQSIAAPTVDPKSPGQTLDRRDDASEEALKYFHEPGRDEPLAHYDRRYFSGIVTDAERTDTQVHMVRAYLSFFRERKLETWIAHGTLLGWWWNGKRLPWDLDLDTQVSNATLHQLGQQYNQTRYEYKSPDDGILRTYLLDVSPWIWERVNGDGFNVIDARWIDTWNGLYIDITGLSETDPDSRPGVWSCKNNHEYETEELYPMRDTMFEGVQAKAPFEYEKILKDEYQPSALTRTEYNGYVKQNKQS
ncbi:hypothetical protein IQ06DRAFT_128878 [Phaeosphaeriaceae sp. SRC1lsM3a]|nr:hypothetical protein IQ06DRAFT_128878 [Stagonospora sp. SRC1lsM3a]